MHRNYLRRLRLRRIHLRLTVASLTALQMTQLAYTDFPIYSGAWRSNQRSIRPYDYRANRPGQSASVDLLDRIGIPKTLAAANVNSQDTSLSPATATSIREYFPKQNKTEVNGLLIETIGLQLFDDGTLLSSCQLSFDGRNERALDGVNVTLELIAFTGQVGPAGTNAPLPMVWQSKKQVWVPTGKPVRVPIGDRPSNSNHPGRMEGCCNLTMIPSDKAAVTQHANLKRHFQQIQAFKLVVQRHEDQ